MFVHGFADHCNAYYNFFPGLSSRGIEVWALDQRGWGRSAKAEANRGDTGPTGKVLDDLRNFIRYVNSQPVSSNTKFTPNPVPLFLMGHSMGGGQILYLSLLESQPEPFPHISGILSESPLVGFAPSLQPNPLVVQVGKLAARVMPKWQLPQKMKSSDLCRNSKICREWEEDELCYTIGTLEGLTGMLQRSADLTSLANGNKVPGLGLRTRIGLIGTNQASVPIWIGHGTCDKVTDFATTQQLFERLDVKDKMMKSYNNAFHKLHVELDGVAEEFLNDVSEWILKHAILVQKSEATKEDARSRL